MLFMSRIEEFIEKYSINQNDRYVSFVNVMKETQPFAFLSAFSISLSIFASRFSLPEASTYAAEAGVLFLLAFISLLCFKFIEPNFGLFLDISHLCTFLGIALFFISVFALINPENFGDAASWLGAISLLLLILFLSYRGYRTSKVDKLFKINVIFILASFFIAIMFGIISEFILYIIKIDIAGYEIFGILFLIMALLFTISLLSLTILSLRRR